MGDQSGFNTNPFNPYGNSNLNTQRSHNNLRTRSIGPRRRSVINSREVSRRNISRSRVRVGSISRMNSEYGMGQSQHVPRPGVQTVYATEVMGATTSEENSKQRNVFSIPNSNGQTPARVPLFRQAFEAYGFNPQNRTGATNPTSLSRTPSRRVVSGQPQNLTQGQPLARSINRSGNQPFIETTTTIRAPKAQPQYQAQVAP
jgi:hypothetical protein